MTQKLSVVTGATRGIGKAIALHLLERGYRVLGTGTDKYNQISESIEYYGVNFISLEETKTFARHLETIKPVILINNAGINLPYPFTQFPLEDFEKMISVNLRAPFILSQACIPHMINIGFGRIVNIASIWSVIGKEQRAPYCATKFGLDGMTAALAAEVSSSGILVNCVSPGFVRTEATEAAFSDVELAQWAQEIPQRRLAIPSEIAKLVGWLVSEDNSYVTGQNYLIDGGLSRI